jgi:hypothetical protein
MRNKRLTTRPGTNNVVGSFPYSGIGSSFEWNNSVIGTKYNIDLANSLNIYTNLYNSKIYTGSFIYLPDLKNEDDLTINQKIDLVIIPQYFAESNKEVNSLQINNIRTYARNVFSLIDLYTDYVATNEYFYSSLDIIDDVFKNGYDGIVIDCNNSSGFLTFITKIIKYLKSRDVISIGSTVVRTGYKAPIILLNADLTGETFILNNLLAYVEEGLYFNPLNTATSGGYRTTREAYLDMLKTYDIEVLVNDFGSYVNNYDVITESHDNCINNNYSWYISLDLRDSIYLNTKYSFSQTNTNSDNINHLKQFLESIRIVNV